MHPTLDIHWQTILETDFDFDDFTHLLRQAHATLTPGSVAAELGRHLVCCDVEKKTLPIPLDTITNLPTTQRIDGILPLLIPQPYDVLRLADELFDEMLILGLDAPDPTKRETIREDLALCYLALLHEKKFRLNYQFEAELQLSCPHSALAGLKDEINLFGHLPLGGRIVVLYSHLKGTHRLTFSSASLEHTSNLTARRINGTLKLTERTNKESGSPDPL